MSNERTNGLHCSPEHSPEQVWQSQGHCRRVFGHTMFSHADQWERHDLRTALGCLDISVGDVLGNEL